MDYSLLEATAKNMRRDIVSMIHEANSGHPGGSLSAVEIVTYLYFHEMNIQNPTDENRDRFVLSKGHAAPVLYAALAEKGFIDKEALNTLRKINSKLQGHPDMRKVPGVEASTGSLGQGLAIGNGMALAAKLDGKTHRIFVLLGDGEVQEGMVWEAAMLAAQYKLDNVTAILDHNKLQIDGRNDDVMSIDPVDEKWAAFGWHVLKADGHNFASLSKAFEERKAVKGRPAIIIAETVKGKGVSFMEDKAGWHGKAPDDEQYEMAVKELGGDM